MMVSMLWWRAVSTQPGLRSASRVRVRPIPRSAFAIFRFPISRRRCRSIRKAAFPGARIARRQDRCRARHYWSRPGCWPMIRTSSPTRTCPDATITKLLNGLWEGTKELLPMHPSMRGYTHDASVTDAAVIPYHPAAVAFYKQKKLWDAEAAERQAALMAEATKSKSVHAETSGGRRPPDVLLISHLKAHRNDWPRWYRRRQRSADGLEANGVGRDFSGQHQSQGDLRLCRKFRPGQSGRAILSDDRPSKTLFVFMHPTSTLQLLPMPTALADAGFHVLCAASRYARNDSALIMEKVVLDLGAWLRYGRHELGYEKIVLVGWSGGGSLSLFYQAQAEKPIDHANTGRRSGRSDFGRSGEGRWRDLYRRPSEPGGNADRMAGPVGAGRTGPG